MTALEFHLVPPSGRLGAAVRRARLAGDVLHERDGTLADERDRHRMGADTLARDAAGGVGGVAEGGHELTGIGSNLGALKLPRGIAALVEMKFVYPTCRSTAVELEFDFHLGTRHCLATDPAGLFASRSAEDAVIVSRGQFSSASSRPRGRSLQ